MIYPLIGRIVVKGGIMLLKHKMVKRTVVIGGVATLAGVAAIGVAGYLATREVPEG